MNNEKIENLLNLALYATGYEREQAPDLYAGYDEASRTWEVIVKYSGENITLSEALSESLTEDDLVRIKVEDLTNRFAILTLPDDLVDTVASLDIIEYMEKPKKLFFAEGGGASFCDVAHEGCGNLYALRGQDALSGRGVIVAMIDSGIDYAHPDFINDDGTTRILYLLDQTTGTEYDSQVIDRAIKEPTQAARYAVCPCRDISGHGTHVAGIACGNGRASDGRYRGVAYDCSIIAVKLGSAKSDGFPMTTELMRAVNYCAAKAVELKMPLVINLSFGNNYGSHSGDALLELYLNDVAMAWKTSIAVGSGNEGQGRGHAAGTLGSGASSDTEIAISPYETSLGIQIWKNYVDDIAVELISPQGVSTGVIYGDMKNGAGTYRFGLEDTDVLLYYGSPTPYSVYQEIYFELIPKEDYLTDGVWILRLIPQNIVMGSYDMWLSGSAGINDITGFLKPDPYTTLTVPSTASGVITVGAYDAKKDTPASFSGRGYTRETDQVKPDVAAPGVDIISCAPGGGYASRTGTSMAAPFVSGKAALLMQWGIADGNDRYMYGEKIKATLRKAAKPIPALKSYPNQQVGYGVL